MGCNCSVQIVTGVLLKVTFGIVNHLYVYVYVYVCTRSMYQYASLVGMRH